MDNSEKIFRLDTAQQMNTVGMSHLNMMKPLDSATRKMMDTIVSMLTLMHDTMAKAETLSQENASTETVCEHFTQTSNGLLAQIQELRLSAKTIMEQITVGHSVTEQLIQMSMSVVDEINGNPKTNTPH